MFYAACHELKHDIEVLNNNREWSKIDAYHSLTTINKFPDWKTFFEKGHIVNMNNGNSIQFWGQRHGNRTSFHAFQELLEKNKFDQIYVDLSFEELSHYENNLSIFQKYEGLEDIRESASLEDFQILQGLPITDAPPITIEEFEENTDLAIDEIFLAFDKKIPVVSIDVPLDIKKEAFEKEIPTKKQGEILCQLWSIAGGICPPRNEEETQQILNLQKDLSINPEKFQNIPSIFALTNVLFQVVCPEWHEDFIEHRSRMHKNFILNDLNNKKNTNSLVFTSATQLFNVWHDLHKYSKKDEN